jgi:hypothetical protein
VSVYDAGVCAFRKLRKFITFDSGVHLTRRLDRWKAKIMFYLIKIFSNTVDEFLSNRYTFSCVMLCNCRMHKIAGTVG